MSESIMSRAKASQTSLLKATVGKSVAQIVILIFESMLMFYCYFEGKPIYNFYWNYLWNFAIHFKRSHSDLQGNGLIVLL